MENIPVLVVSKREGKPGRMVVDVLSSFTGVELVLASEPGEVERQFSTRSFAFAVVDRAVIEQDHNSALDYIRKAVRQNNIPLVFIVKESSEADQLCSGFGPGVVDCLPQNSYISRALLKNKFQMLLELSSLKREVTLQATELDAGVLELEVLQQELLEKTHKLEMHSSLDGITGLFNRYYFDDNLQKEWRQAVRLGVPISLLFIDVDYLKAYNEYYGHLEGDVCLCQLAGALYSGLHRPVDIIARYGGDQFAVILPGTDVAGAGLVAERMMENVASLEKEHLASPVSAGVTVSIGGSTTVPSADKNIQDFTVRAEQALGEAKNAGRNCIRHL